jgi:two-component system NtrC family sensor kinase
METHRIGAIVAVPRGSPSPTLFLVLGTRADEWPYTYPEIERLLNLAELVDNLLTRSQLAEQEAMRAKMEYLAVMSRGLAHDLKNLITPISSFLVYTEERIIQGSAEADVHASACHSVEMMNAYVRDALFFAQRLEPNLGRTDIKLLLDKVVDASSGRAAQRNVRLDMVCDATDAITADAVLLQRLLANLVANAIDASPEGESVLIVCHPSHDGWICFEVSDQGPGIAPENLRRVFDPYFTTKQFGSDIRGFGLGLTICQKIAQLHQGTVSFASGRTKGALARFEMPVVPTPSSTPRLCPIAF